MTATAKFTVVETKLLVRDPGSMFSFLIPVFILIVFVMVLNLVARIIGAYFAPKTERRR